MKTFVPPDNGYALRSLFTLRHTELYSLRRVWAMLVTVLPRIVAESAKLVQAVKANLPARRNAKCEGGRGLGYGG